MSITSVRMKQRRKELGLRAEDIADRIGVSRATLFRYESGGIEKVPFNALAPLAQALSTNVAWLAGWSDDENQIDMLPESMITPENREAYENRTPMQQRLINLVLTIPENKTEDMIHIIESILSYAEAK